MGKEAYLIETISNPPRWLINESPPFARLKGEHVWGFTTDPNHPNLMKFKDEKHAKKWLKKRSDEIDISDLRVTGHEWISN